MPGCWALSTWLVAVHFVVAFALAERRHVGKDADPDIPILKQAKAEYAKVQRELFTD
jgi:hypothetical protein